MARHPIANESPHVRSTLHPYAAVPLPPRRLPSAVRILWWVALVWFALGALFVLGARLTGGYSADSSLEDSRAFGEILIQIIFIEFLLVFLAGGLTFACWLHRELED